MQMLMQITIIVLILTGSVLIAFADVPHTITYQGRLTNAVGVPVEDGIYELAFTLYPDSILPDFFWQEVQPVEVSGGFFDAQLGQYVPIPFGPFVEVNPPNLYLGITLPGNPEMAPRIKLSSIGYAIKAFHADEAGWAMTSDFSGHAETVADSSITEISIKDGSIGLNDLGQNGASVGQIIKWTPSGWEVGNDETSPSDDGDWILSDYVLYTAGEWGIARAGNTPHGSNNITHVNLGVACTTGTSGSNSSYVTVGGGGYNNAAAVSATVAGGTYNRATEGRTTVGGGYHNTAGDVEATVSGGQYNTASGAQSTVAGGEYNLASGWQSTVSGGHCDTASANFTTVGGGRDNVASGIHSTVGGGAENRASDNSTTVAGGYSNTATANGASVCGGVSNDAHGMYSTVLGGNANTASGFNSLAAGFCANAAHTGSFVWSDYLQTVFFNSAADNEFAARATGGVRFVTGILPDVGVQIASGGGSWSPISDRNVKENFCEVDAAAILERLALIPISTWNYRTQDESIRHIGPVAQDFHSAFGVGEDDRHITTVDADGIALAAIQALYFEQQKLKEKTEELETLRSELMQLRKLVEKLVKASQPGSGSAAEE